MKVEVLYLEGCPNHPPTLDRVRQALAAERLTAEMREIEVRNADEARSIGFLGSPSVRVDGLDIEADARALQTYGFGCRTYFEDGGCSGAPSVELIRYALTEATNNSGSADRSIE